MTPPSRNPQSPCGDAPDIVRAIEAIVAALTQQRNNMMQQHEASIQRHATSLEQQQLVMQEMEATRVATEDAHRQHMEALRQLEEKRIVALFTAPNHDLHLENGVWSTF